MSEVAVDCIRLRTCAGATCGAPFAVCVGCDRGQRYCSDGCRKAARRQQMRSASRRYQATDRGKESHRCRQRSYHERRSDERMTHQALAATGSAAQASPLQLSACVICGCQSRWIDPFPVLPRHLRRRPGWSRRSAGSAATFGDGPRP